jgi:hypothetical protein
MERMAKAKVDKANKAPRELTMLEQIQEKKKQMEAKAVA